MEAEEPTPDSSGAEAGRRLTKMASQAVDNAAWHVSLDLAARFRGSSAADTEALRRALERELRARFRRALAEVDMAAAIERASGRR